MEENAPPFELPLFPLQSVLFPAPGEGCAYVCSFTGIARIVPVRA